MSEQEEWTTPQPAHTPRPTYWPAALALGVTVTLWGLIVSKVILGGGLVLSVLSIVRWIQELLHDQP
jgi:hypothetical protein